MDAPVLSARESLRALAAACTIAAGVLFEALFLGQSTLAFPVSDPRADIRPWARTAAVGEALPDVNLATPDIVGYVLPGLIRARQLLADSGSTAWDDGQLLGFPFAANQHFPVPSHVEWLTRPFDPVTALDLLLAAHIALALWLAYRAARLLGGAPHIAAIAAVGFAFSGWMISRWHCAPMTWASSWFPLQLSALVWLRRGATARAIFEFGLATGLALVSGFPQAAILLTGAALLLAGGEAGLRAPRAALALGAAALLGAALALPQLLPALQLDGRSLRATPDARHALADSRVPPGALAAQLLPSFFGDPVAFGRPDPPAPTMEDWLPQRLLFEGRLQTNVAEVSSYAGLLALLLVPLALRGAAGATARRFLLVALLALAGAIFAPLLLTLTPATERLAIGNPKRLLAVFDACLPFAAAFAAQAVLERRARLPWAWGAALLAALIGAPLWAARLDAPDAARFAADLQGQALRQAPLLLAALAALWWARREAATAPARTGGPAKAPDGAPFASSCRLAAWLPALVLAIDLIGFARGFNPPVPQERALPERASIAALAERPGRIAVFAPGENVLPPTLASAAGLRAVHGLTAMVPARTAELLACLEGPLFDARDPRSGRPLREVATLRSPLLDLLAVDTIVHADPGLAAASGLPVLFERADEGLGALSRPSAGPPAFLCGGALVLPDARERLGWLAARDAPVFQTALLEREPTQPLPPRGARTEVTTERPHAGRILVRSDAPAPGVLVVSESWDPGWTLTLDGASHPVEIVDHALLGAILPPGRHVADFTYTPPHRSLASGLALSAVILLLVCAYRARST